MALPITRPVAQRTALWLLMLALCADVLALPLRLRADAAHAQSAGCNAASLSGSYGFVFSGSVLAGGATEAVPATVVGLINYDGSGNVSYTFTQNAGGRVAATTWTGTYTVQTDCTGTDAVNDGSRSHAFVITAGGSHVSLTATDADLVGVGEADLLPPGTCDASSFAGAYGAVAQGFTLRGPDGQPLTPPQPRTESSLFMADGAGNITKVSTVNAGGTVSPNPATGTYAVQPECTFDATYTRPGGPTVHGRGVLLDGGQRAFSIGVDAGATVTLRWERQ